MSLPNKIAKQVQNRADILEIFLPSPQRPYGQEVAIGDFLLSSPARRRRFRREEGQLPPKQVNSTSPNSPKRAEGHAFLAHLVGGITYA